MRDDVTFLTSLLIGWDYCSAIDSKKGPPVDDMVGFGKHDIDKYAVRA